MTESFIFLVLALIIFGPAIIAAILVLSLAPRQSDFINLEFVSHESPSSIQTLLLETASNSKGYSISSLGESTVQFKREYNPNWTIALAIGGAFVLSPFALLILFYRDSEICTVQLSSNEFGTRVQISGAATKELSQKLAAIAGNCR